MEVNETVEEAAVRELVEETEIVVPAKYLKMSSSFNNPAEHQVLIFNELKYSGLIPREEDLRLNEFKGTSECSALRIATELEELAFPSHTAALAAALARIELVGG